MQCGADTLVRARAGICMLAGRKVVLVQTSLARLVKPRLASRKSPNPCRLLSLHSLYVHMCIPINILFAHYSPLKPLDIPIHHKFCVRPSQTSHPHECHDDLSLTRHPEVCPVASDGFRRVL